jgi:hypothetical protein
MKSNGFKWSPSNTAWQRQLTSNAFWGLWRALNIDLKNQFTTA